MSRRPPDPVAERVAKNQSTIKSLLKLEHNKLCADCKRNKHPRWASWNLGVFICIRCSGIHRGMGTHISRVKSVDLDAWTDEQLQSILKWGNARANKYWESKLAPGHVPSEAKIENFIRTKYELKRWVTDGPMPDPSTLDAEGDDDVPLSVVKEKQVIDRKVSLKHSQAGLDASAASGQSGTGDLLGGGDFAVGFQSNAATKPAPPPKAPPKATANKDSLLGLDFLSTESSTITGPSNAKPTQVTRPDLKQSILSLYATAPKPQTGGHQMSNSVGSANGLVSPTQAGGNAAALQDVFSSLNINNSLSSPPLRNIPAAADPFASIGSGLKASSPATSTTASFDAFGGGGNFFDSQPSTVTAAPKKHSVSSGLGDLVSLSATSPLTSIKPTKPITPSTAAVKPPSSGLDDLTDWSSQVSMPAAPAAISSLASTTSPSLPMPPQVTQNSTVPASSTVFNLSSKPVKSPPAAPVTTTTTSTFGSGNFSGADVWGSNDWASSATESVASKSPQATITTTAGGDNRNRKLSGNDFGWASSSIGSLGGGASGDFASTSIVPGPGGFTVALPKVAADEEFGGWTSSTGDVGGGAMTGGSGKTASAGGAGFSGHNEDLFSNVWQ